MGMLDDMMLSLQAPGLSGSGIFPAVLPVVDEAARMEAERLKEDERQARLSERLFAKSGSNLLNERVDPLSMPYANSAGIQLALNNAPAGTGIPVAPGATFGSLAPTLPMEDQAQMPETVPLPRARPQMPSPMSLAPAVDEAALPAAAALTAGQVAAPTAPETPGFLDRAWSGVQKNAPLLLAMGAGFAGAPSFGHGMSRAFAGAGPVVESMRQQDLLNQTQNSTAMALARKGATPEEIASAKGNKDVMKALVSKYFETKAPMVVNGRVVRELPDGSVKQLADYSADKWKIVETGENDNGGKMFRVHNPDTNEFQDIPASTKITTTDAPGARPTIQGPDGKPIEIPPGVNVKAFRDSVSRTMADAASGKKTEVQAKSEKFGNQMELAEKNLRGLEGQGTSLFGQIASGVPLGNYVQSDEYKNYMQAMKSFITALLRDESGAAVQTPEFVRREKEMFPQPGDGPEQFKRKAELRAVALEGMRKAAGPGYKSAAGVEPLAVGKSTTVNGVTIRRIE